jgi:hypothetical protein
MLGYRGIAGGKAPANESAAKQVEMCSMEAQIKTVYATLLIIVVNR